MSTPAVLLLILAKIPLWVFGLLALLIALGLQQSRDRQVKPQVLIGVTVGMATWTAWGLAAQFGADALAWGGWLAGLALATTVAAPLLVPAGIRPLPGARAVHMPGSWWPMAVMLGLFTLRFAMGLAQGAGHPVPPATPAAALCGLMLGVCNGAFAARALAARRALGPKPLTADADTLSAAPAR